MSNTTELKLRQKFVEEGRFAALPLAIPGETLPIPEDESAITAMAENLDGSLLYGATSGEKCHIFISASKGTKNGILDLGVVENALDIPAIVCLDRNKKEAYPHYIYDQVVFAANFGLGAALYNFKSTFPGDTFQEPSFILPEFSQAVFLENVRIFDVVKTTFFNVIFCLTDKGVLKFDCATNTISTVFEADLTNIPIKAFAVISNETAYFTGNKHKMIKINLTNGTCKETAISTSMQEPGCGYCVIAGKIIYARQSGELVQLDTERETTEIIGSTMLPDVQCMSALPDGRIYGICGQGIGYFFKFDLHSRTVNDMGAIAAALGTKRYGFEFSRMLTGRNGEVYLGEKDRGGHLWIYFPALN
jgi:hypothetical protein